MYDKAIEICKAVAREGGRAFFVGGYVRDMVIGREPDDIDIEAFHLSQDKLEQILKYFGEVNYVGKCYGAYKVSSIDVTMPRIDTQTGPLHTDLETEIEPDLDYEKAAKRRDFTINAIMYDPLKAEFFDFFGGRHYISGSLIRHIDSDSFIEDPLRIIRAARFHATLNFDISFLTSELMRAHKRKTLMLPKERIFGELIKALMEAKQPSRLFKCLQDIDALGILFPELQALHRLDQGNTHHTEDALEHTLMAIDVLPIERRELDVQLAALFHDIGKVLCRTVDEDGNVHFYGHHELGIPLFKNALARLTNDNDLTHSVISLCANHMLVYPLISGPTKKSVRRLASKCDIYKLMKLHECDRQGRENKADISHIERILSVYEEVKDQVKPMITGKHLIGLGERPGAHFGPILNKIYQAQLDGEFETVAEGILYVKAKIL